MRYSEEAIECVKDHVLHMGRMTISFGQNCDFIWAE